MKQIAVEWLEEMMNVNGNISVYFQEILEQAKAMEKEQIIESYCQGCADISNNDNIFPRETSEQYYNETFKSE